MKKRLLWIFIFVAFAWAGFTENQAALAEKKPEYWIDPMEPRIHYPAPGKSRMGMELVPVYKEDKIADDSTSVRISPAIVNNLGIRTAPVKQGTLARKIETVGYIEPDENEITHIHSYAEGWIEKLTVKTLGEPVKKGQLLFQFYSPTLVNVQEEYLSTLEARNPQLVEASHKKLLAFRISEQQIQRLRKSRKSSPYVDIYSPQNGIVAALHVREGMHVTPDMEIMSLVDLSHVWLIAQVFEDQAGWIRVGEPAQATLSAFPGKTWKGEVDYIYPQLDPTTRTLRVRFRFANPDHLLKPNMYAQVTLSAQPKQNVLSIPQEALIRSSHGDRVIVMKNEGEFQVRPVIAGIESGDRIEIVSGLKAGEQVVTSGQFLIDSEANLKAGLERLESKERPE